MYTELLIDGIIFVILAIVTVYTIVKLHTWSVQLRDMIREELKEDYDPTYMKTMRSDMDDDSMVKGNDDE